MSDPSIIRQWMSDAHRLAQAGRFDEALDACRKVCEHDPHNLEVRGQIIELCQRMGNFQEVLLQHMDCAEILTLQERREEALRHYEHVLRLEEAASLSGQDAVAAARQLIAQYKPEIYFQIGGYHFSCGKLDLALQYLRKSRELSPGLWQTHLALGRCYQAQGLHREAIGEYQEVLRLAPEESAQAYEGLGEIFVAQGRPAHTTSVWFAHSADYYRKKGQFENARRALLRWQQIQPDSPECAVQLAELPSSSSAAHALKPESGLASMDDWVSGR